MMDSKSEFFTASNVPCPWSRPDGTLTLVGSPTTNVVLVRVHGRRSHRIGLLPGAATRCLKWPPILGQEGSLRFRVAAVVEEERGDGAATAAQRGV